MANYAFQKYIPSISGVNYTPYVWNGSAWVQYDAYIYSRVITNELFDNSTTKDAEETCDNWGYINSIISVGSNSYNLKSGAENWYPDDAFDYVQAEFPNLVVVGTYDDNSNYDETYYYPGALVSKEKIDFTNYSKLTIVVKGTIVGTNVSWGLSPGIKVSLCKGYSADYVIANSDNIYTTTKDNISSKTTITINLTSAIKENPLYIHMIPTGYPDGGGYATSIMLSVESIKLS